MESDLSNQDNWQQTEASEVARVFFGNPYMIASLGRALPEVIPMETVQKVLDIGCGTGEWARSLAQEHPHVRTIGIDTSHKLIKQAVALAKEQKIGSVAFFEFDPSQKLNFPGDSCDVVHVHSLASFITTARWEYILEDILRVLKPGGWLNIVDYEQGSTSSPAFNELHIMGMKGIRALGGSIAPSSPTYGVAARLYGFLVDAGMIDVSYKVHSVDFGIKNRPEAAKFLDDLVVGMCDFKEFVLMLGLGESDHFDTLIEKARYELSQPTSCGYAYLISAVGRKDF
jgi:SAM-dependent methyltransferase